MKNGLEILLGDTKGRIMRILLDGDSSIVDLTRKLKINQTAMRSHLDKLENDGFVTSYNRPSPVGRPKKYYVLTDAGYDLFPKRYEMLFDAMISAIIKNEGIESLKHYIKEIVSTITANKDIHNEEKEIMMNEVVEYLNDIGFYAEGSIDNKNHEITITRKNCILRQVAKKRPEIICHIFEKELINRYFGDGRFRIISGTGKENNHCVTKIKYS